jgi:signal transduction histidine kinase
MSSIRVEEQFFARAAMLGEDRTLLETLERRNRNLNRVNEVSQKLTSILDTEQVLGYLLEASADIIGAPVASAWLWENEGQRALACRATFPPSELDDLRSYRIRPDEGVAGWVVTHGVSAVTGNAYKDQRFISDIDRETGFFTQSMLAVPLVVRNEVTGVIEILNKHHADFDEEDLAMVETLAAAAAIALENATLVTSLQNQNSELDAFAHTVAHDLKGPLSMILGFSDMLESGTDFLDSAEIVQICSVIARNAKKMDSIIKEILLLSGVRRKEVPYSQIDMRPVVEESLGRILHLTQEFNAEISVPATWPVAVGYAPWVEEVWVNYISNAVKYGGRPPVIELGFTEEADTVWFWVRDNGKGLRKEEQAQLFVPFTRLEQIRVKGHGLGLSIVQRIVTKLGGKLAIESVLGEGSRFMFSLPKRR